MVQTLSSLAFKGTITEAIMEAKQQKKLFVVYVSGDNVESNNLEISTWTDSRVTDSVVKFCILLRISEGSVDAANFSAIYPQRSAPCITAIGYNGIQLWQHEGFVTADVLASSIEKAWLSLHIQETTATFLSAALASKNQLVSGISDNAEEGSSSRTEVMLSQTGPVNDSADIRPSLNHEIIQEDNCPESAVQERESKIGDEAASPGSSLVNELENGVLNEDTSYIETAKSLLAPAVVDSSSTQDESHIQKENFVESDHLSEAEEVSQEIANESNQCLQENNKEVVSHEVVNEANEGLEDNTYENVLEKADIADFPTNKSNDVHLNVRLPDGSSLQAKYSMMDTLRTVKDYVDDNNQTSSFGSYDLAIPYPRKVFSEQDLGQTLQELGLSNRQALIVVMHRRANSHPQVGSLPHGINRGGSSNGSNEGYWGYMRRVLSYMNPLSYLGGRTNSTETAQESQNSMWQYGPNPSLQNNLRSLATDSSNPSATPTSRSSNRRSMQQSSSRFGSNIHTLKHDENESQFGDRNAYWNGNSTQFGGDNEGK